MSKPNDAKKPANGKGPSAIAQLSVCGYKSISREETIEIRPLTILAGANSSGKSSMMQPLLLVKQTLEATYNPPGLKIDGPNVKFTSIDQFLSRTGKSISTDVLEIGVTTTWNRSVRITFRKRYGEGLAIDQMRSEGALGDNTLWPKMTHAEIQGLDFAKHKNWKDELPDEHADKARWHVVKQRCFLEPQFEAKKSDEPGTASFFVGQPLTEGLENLIVQVIHVPALRGNPERSYGVTAVGPTYPGTFERYTASVIAQWATENDQNDREKLRALNEDLVRVELTGGVWQQKLYETQIELLVSRLAQIPPLKPEDRVNIADVGFGVSQTLPLLVALRVAQPGQLVYIEQPEIHLHPKAQVALAQVLAAAAQRDVRVVAETHSSLLLRGIQTLVAGGTLPPDLVKLHWFQRESDGHTVVRSADLDEHGAFGDWPEDFDSVSLDSESRYLDAAESRR